MTAHLCMSLGAWHSWIVNTLIVLKLWMALLIQTSVSCGSHNLLQCSLLAFPWPKLFKNSHLWVLSAPVVKTAQQQLHFLKGLRRNQLVRVNFYCSTVECADTCHYSVVCRLYSGWKEKTAEVDEVSWSLDETTSPVWDYKPSIVSVGMDPTLTILSITTFLFEKSPPRSVCPRSNLVGHQSSVSANGPTPSCLPRCGQSPLMSTFLVTRILNVRHKGLVLQYLVDWKGMNLRRFHIHASLITDFNRSQVVGSGTLPVDGLWVGRIAIVCQWTVCVFNSLSLGKVEEVLYNPLGGARSLSTPLSASSAAV